MNSFLSVATTADYPFAPLNYFLHSYGPASMPVMHVGWAFVALLTLIFIIVSLLLLWAVLSKRSADIPHEIGSEDRAMMWIYIGAGLSTSILCALAIYMLVTLNKTAKPAQEPALTLAVTDYDWWWKSSARAKSRKSVSSPPMKSTFRSASRCRSN